MLLTLGMTDAPAPLLSYTPLVPFLRFQSWSFLFRFLLRMLTFSTGRLQSCPELRQTQSSVQVAEPCQLDLSFCLESREDDPLVIIDPFVKKFVPVVIEK